MTKRKLKSSNVEKLSVPESAKDEAAGLTDAALVNPATPDPATANPTLPDPAMAPPPAPPPNDAQTQSLLLPDDEQLRRLAAVRLAEHLDRGAALIARCQNLAQSQRGDRLGPIYAAARLMRADAGVAQALAHVVMVERRSRTIVEQIQRPDKKTAELNSILEKQQKDREKRKSIQEQLKEKVQQAIQREKDELAAIAEQEKQTNQKEMGNET